MDLQPPPLRSPLSAYEEQADRLLEAHRAADPAAIDLFHRKHPRFLDETIKWRPKFIADSEIRDAALSLDDARLAIARNYDFLDWPALVDYVDAVSRDGPVHAFEAAVEAVVGGDLGALHDALRRDPALVHARSSRVCCFDPPVHRATLLHYIAANGVEAYRQRTPGNAVEIARTLLVAGAEPDALADMYGTACTTMSMLVSSSHPAEAGLQVVLAGLLLDFGAAIEGRGGKWERPLFAALAFGMSDVAKLLAERGARIDLAAASGLGLAREAARLVSSADEEERRRALSLAAQQGHAEIVALLLDSGLDPNRYNPVGNHPHCTPLHQAVLGGHEDGVRLLVARGARLDVRDTIWDGTPLGWAIHGGCRDRERMIECLRELGAED
ncbi:MAG: ankyrin repeat domain-containing protein [Bradyrhizobium sp.]|nr:ankyrin repeat domain-containing protein [Bradyrhizobium sp.]